jgi:hypothetical protein
MLPASGGFLDLIRTDAGCADANPLVGAVDHGFDRLQIEVPTPLGDVVGVTDAIAELRAPAADITNLCHKEKL